MQLDKDVRAAMDRVVSGLATKSDKIRALGRAQFARGDIARYLNIRYQHVRNVLIASEKKQSPAEETEPLPPQEWAQVSPDGRVVIPAPYRKALGIEGTGHVLMLWENGEVRLVGRDAAIRRAQVLVSRYVPKGSRLSDELIADRRAEVARESGDDQSRS